MLCRIKRKVNSDATWRNSISLASGRRVEFGVFLKGQECRERAQESGTGTVAESWQKILISPNPQRIFYGKENLAGFSDQLSITFRTQRSTCDKLLGIPRAPVSS